MFADWVPDTEEIYKEALQNDFRKWKVPKVVRDDTDLKAVM